MKKIYWFSLVGCILLLMGGCTTVDSSKEENQQSKTEQTQQKQQTTTIIIQEDGKQLSSKTVSFKTGDNLLTVLKENFAIEEEQGFITSIDGYKQDKQKQKYWTFTIDGKSATKGAKEIVLKKNQQIVFDLAKI
ncbi:MAG: DUF4430 domain-containing protein [Enterococcus durans]